MDGPGAASARLWRFPPCSPPPRSLHLLCYEMRAGASRRELRPCPPLSSLHWLPSTLPGTLSPRPTLSPAELNTLSCRPRSPSPGSNLPGQGRPQETPSSRSDPGPCAPTPWESRQSQALSPSLRCLDGSLPEHVSPSLNRDFRKGPRPQEELSYQPVTGTAGTEAACPGPLPAPGPSHSRQSFFP